MLFQRFFDELEYVGNTIVLAKGIVDEKITSIKVDRLIRQSDKIEAKKTEELEGIEYEFWRNIDDDFGNNITFNNLDSDKMLEYTDEWYEQFKWLSSFMTKIIESRNDEEFNPDEFEKNDIQKWVNYLSDQEVKENIYAFNMNHQSNMLTWVIQQCNEILSNYCPEYAGIQYNEKSKTTEAAQEIVDA